MKKFENKMLRDLYESVKGLYAYTFYSRYSIEPEEMFAFILKYQEKGIIKYDGDFISLTDAGHNILLKQLFFNKESNGKFSNIPEEFISEKIEINSPYLPNIRNISSEILNIKKVV